MLKKHLLLISLALFSVEAFAGSPEIQENFKNLTLQCEKKTVNSWLLELKQLQTKLYEYAYEVTEEKFTQDLMGKDLPSNSELIGDLYWPYMLYGGPYMSIPSGFKESMLQRIASSCYVYLYEFEDALETRNYAFADESISVWKSCVWTWFHKTQPEVEEFESCYKNVLKD